MDILSDVLQGGGLNQDTILAGLKQALEVGSNRAVGQLSAPGGYGQDPNMHIPLPGKLADIAQTLRRMGLGGQLDIFEVKMNEAAEHAAKQATPVSLDTIRKMSFTDAQNILQGSDTAATEYFRYKTHDRLTQLYAPIVEQHLNQVGALSTYNDLIGRYHALPLVPQVDFSPQQYATGKALDGLFSVLADVETDIRTKPGCADYRSIAARIRLSIAV